MAEVPVIGEITKHIYTLRGEHVMLDRDLAALYEVKPIRLREQVKRNKERFPSDFMFRLTEEEATLMVSQNAIPSMQYFGGSLPYKELKRQLDELIVSSDAADIAKIGFLR